MSAPVPAALFDMDRTLVRRSTAELYTRYQRDRGETTLLGELRVALWMLRYSVGLLDADHVAERALQAFRGRNEEEFLVSCQHWFKEYVLPHVAVEGRRVLEEHRTRGEILVLVTAASQYAALPLAEELKIPHVICTELGVHAGSLSGRVEGRVCFGAEKVRRVAELGRAQGFDLASAAFYSDSITDLPLLEAVGIPVAVNPDARLRRVARKRAWRIEYWD